MFADKSACVAIFRPKINTTKLLLLIISRKLSSICFFFHPFQKNLSNSIINRTFQSNIIYQIGTNMPIKVVQKPFILPVSAKNTKLAERGAGKVAKRRRIKVSKYAPIFKWLPKYTKYRAVSDIIAGITIGLTMIPQSIAYATLAGLSPQVCYFWPK